VSTLGHRILVRTETSISQVSTGVGNREGTVIGTYQRFFNLTSSDHNSLCSTQHALPVRTCFCGEYGDFTLQDLAVHCGTKQSLSEAFL
jgi:hypothetical protein